jgi:hypothetical protein
MFYIYFYKFNALLERYNSLNLIGIVCFAVLYFFEIYDFFLKSTLCIET